MTGDQRTILAVLVVTFGLFLWGRWRHDIVALAALIVCALLGLVPADETFSGFGHPAVVTVACVLILSDALSRSGAVDALARRLLPSTAGPYTTIAVLTTAAAVLSSFMNNVGALALLMPIGLRVANKIGLPPGRILMPLAFGSVLGGVTTLIGTPPNLIVSGIRENATGSPFAMFDFAPVGVPIATLGVIFIVVLGWRFVPVRKREGDREFEVGAYFTEVRVPEKSKAIGKSLREVEEALDEAGGQILSLVRNDFRLDAPRGNLRVRAKDLLVIEAEAGALPQALASLGLVLEEIARLEKKDAEDRRRKKEGDGEATAEEAETSSDPKPAAEGEKPERTPDDERVLAEFVILPRSELVGRSARDMRLRSEYGVNLVAVSRQGRRSVSRLRTIALRSGDVLLLQASPASLAEFARDSGCLPLADREFHVPDRRRAILSCALMALAVIASALGWAPAEISFASCALLSVLLRTTSLRDLYSAIDGSVIVLLAALIPVADALESTGAGKWIAHSLVDHVARGDPKIALAVVLIVTMVVSDIMNNAATAAIMCPIAMSIAANLGVDPDAMLMAVAIGASCAFLTPIGHQNNTLILGPGGFRFGDYWRLGLPLEILVVAISVPALLWAWPLTPT